MAAKYVAGLVKGCPAAIIIPECMQHSDIKNLFSEVTSAGFVSVGSTGQYDVDVSIYGKSVSLGVESNEKDLWLVKNAIGLSSDL
jgi:hypothetical protein